MSDFSQLKIYFSGDLVPLSDARVSIFDHALLLGDMVFEMTRSFNHQPFMLDSHLERLHASLMLLEIDCGLTRSQMKQATLDTIEANLPLFEEGLDYWIRHDVSRGPVSLWHHFLPKPLRPTVIISVLPVIGHITSVADAYENGVHVVIPSQRAIPSRYLDPKAKTRSRQHYEMANLQAARIEKSSWPVLLDEHGYLAEGTSYNVFLVKDGILYTPEPHNILRGISRTYVMDMALRLALPVHEKKLEPYDFLMADEAFLTASSYTILPVVQFEGRPVGDGKVGPVYQRLLQTWGEQVGVDIADQAKKIRAKYGE
jgi:branched-chain amino acid aminotransferase